MLKVNRKSFIDALSITNRAVSNKGTGSLRVLQHIRLHMEKNKGTLTGTDLESAIVYPFEGNCAKQTDVLLPAKKLLDVLKNVQSNEETVNIEIKKENVGIDCYVDSRNKISAVYYEKDLVTCENGELIWHWKILLGTRKR